MLGLLLLYFIGKAFHRLAEEHNRSKWGFAILGIVVYYAGTFLAGITFGLLSEFGVTDFFIELPDLAMSFFALPFGILACWGLFKILENNWKNQPKEGSNEALDSDLIKPRQE